MGKRDRVKNIVRTLFQPDKTFHGSPAPAQNTPSAQPPSTTPNVGVPASAASRSLVFENALAIQLRKIPDTEKNAFIQASRTIDEKSLLSDVQAYDLAHKSDSAFRPHAESLTKTLDLLNRFMGGVAIGIQANPEVSAIVVGSFRVAIDLALKFTTFFSRLTDMICTFKDFLEPLALYQSADSQLLKDITAKIYANILDFGWKARRVFIDINGEKRKWTSFRAFLRQHWDTFELEFMSIKEDMQHHIHVLSLIVQGLHFDASQRAERNRILEEEMKGRSAFLAWVSDIDFEKVHQDIHAKKHERTCQWLTEEVAFQRWFTQPSSSLLWCYGKPGIGKSVLTSHVLEHITSEKGLQEENAICFAYYNYRDTRLEDASHIIAALIKQVCRKKNKIPHGLLQAQHEALPPPVLGTQERFVSLVEDMSQVYVIFDALDECPEPKRRYILSSVTGIILASIPCSVKVFVTSRREMDIAKAFEDKQIPAFQIQADHVAADIKAFTLDELDKLRVGQHGRVLYLNSNDLKEEIAQTLASRADGMFLWVNLQLEHLCMVSKVRKDSAVRRALETLPQGLPDTYIRILDRIENQPQEMRDLALDCLAWTVYAQRPLTTRELQVALATKPTYDSLSDLELDSPEVILEACGNLLEDSSGAIRPIHYTVQEFLGKSISGLREGSLKQKLQDSNGMHRRLATVCLCYIQLAAFDQPARSHKDLYKRLESNALAHYSCHNFDYHIVQCHQAFHTTWKELENLFQQDNGYFAAVLQIKAIPPVRAMRDLIYAARQYFNNMSFPISAATFIYGTHLYNRPDLRQRWAVEAIPKYALHLATSAGLADAVTRLLQAGCDINETDGTGATAAYYASSGAHLSILQSLLDSGAGPNVQGGCYGNPLQSASERGYEQIVQLLLNSGANINAQGGYFGHALMAASRLGHRQIVELLLNSGANVDARGRYNRNALQEASAQGHREIVEMLLNRGAEINAQCEVYGSSLQAASSGAHTQIVQLLLEKGADINAQCGYYGSAINAAVHWGHEQTVELLLSKGAKVDDTALQWAANEGHDRILRMLQERRALQTED